jgi:hypothetical protein
MCKACGRVITKVGRERYSNMCWECGHDLLTEESFSMFDVIGLGADLFFNDATFEAVA